MRERWEDEAIRAVVRLWTAVGLLVLVAGVVWALWFS